MKNLKAISFSLAAVAALAGTASAATVRVAGSTAFRGPATAAIIDYLNGIKGSRTLHASYDHSSSSLLGANSAILADGTLSVPAYTDANSVFHPAVTGNATTIIECGWTGSASGVVDIVAQNPTGYYLDPSLLPNADLTQFNASTVSVIAGATAAIQNDNGGTTPTAGSTGYGGGNILTTDVTQGSTGANVGQPHQGAANTLAAIPDFVFSDVSAGTVSTVIASADPISAAHPVGTYTNLASLAAAISSIPADGGVSGGPSNSAATVGIVPFQWAVGKITASGVTPPTNMTAQTALTLLSVGQVSQSFFTGTNTTADVNNQFYLIGRNEDSGTRIDSFAETQFGPASTPAQYQALGTGTLSGVNPYPVTSLNTEANLGWGSKGAGHSGYVGGGQVGNALSLVADGIASPNTFLIGYLGVADAAQKVSGGTLMTYNGVPYSITAVENGSYSFWSLEHLYVNPNHLSSAAQTVENELADDIYANDADLDKLGWHTDIGAHSDTPAVNGTSAVSGGVLYPKTNVSRLSASPIGLPEGGPLSHN